MTLKTMNEHNTNVTEVTESVQDEAALSLPGRKLKQAREDLGLNQTKVAESLQMTVHYVKALEDDEYDKLPGKIFVKGYLKSYAKLLNIESQDLIKNYELYTNAREASEASEAKVVRARKTYDANIRWMICAAIIILVVIAASWWYGHDRGQNTAGIPSLQAVTSAETDANQETNANGPALINAVTVEVNSIGSLESASEENAIEAEAETLLESIVSENVTETLTEVEIVEVVEVAEVAEAVEVAKTTETPLSVDVTTIDNAAALTEEVETIDTLSQIETIQSVQIDRTNGVRVVNLESIGSDSLQMVFIGTSWIEVDNGNGIRLYNDMFAAEEILNIKGQAPFNVLIGDANAVSLVFNYAPVDLSASIRSDSSARILLQANLRNAQQ
ncbi:DUF4115 domain-containing protein [Gammaproteobacteria bacterium]|nr:DUF4115 domain-containing protein [Gammaproteobacteria bacterium]